MPQTSPRLYNCSYLQTLSLMLACRSDPLSDSCTSKVGEGGGGSICGDDSASAGSNEQMAYLWLLPHIYGLCSPQNTDGESAKPLPWRRVHLSIGELSTERPHKHLRTESNSVRSRIEQNWALQRMPGPIGLPHECLNAVTPRNRGPNFLPAC